MIKPKSKGAGIIISDFVDEHQGFPCTYRWRTPISETVIQKSSNMPMNFWSIVRAAKDTGREINSLLKWREQ